MSEYRFFLTDGPADSGKTYLYKTLIDYMSQRAKTVLRFVIAEIATEFLVVQSTHNFLFQFWEH